MPQLSHATTDKNVCPTGEEPPQLKGSLNFIVGVLAPCIHPPLSPILPQPFAARCGVG